MIWLALDIGGANLKVADGQGFAASHPFALWKDKERLAWELRSAIAESPPHDHLVVTMTGELADCFASKAEGVKFILQAVHEASDGRHTRVYLVNGTFVSLNVALSRPLMAASANWHALACFCGRFTPQRPAWLIDVGSTTVDIIPLIEGKPAAAGDTDTDRLLAGQLVYTGVERSPVCALARTLPYRRQECPVAQELFATTRDAYLLLGDLPESPNDRHTADHRPATREAACRRMARMLSANEEQFGPEDAALCAQRVAQEQLAQLVHAAERVRDAMPSPPETTILSGHGEFLARRLLDALGWRGEIISLVERLGPTVSRCAPSHALAVLAKESTEH
jgi:(4-(4-[2-(gamma-L-glutamylamino)ethyl]phenoxymethyl)furan-2-yl)methanamine synthase